MTLAALATGVAGTSVAIADTTTTTSQSTTTTSTTTTVRPTTTTTVRPQRPGPTLRLGDHGPAVLTLQRRLAAQGYWIGGPNGIFGDSTLQAVYALQKLASLPRDGVAGRATQLALIRGVKGHPRSKSGTLVEINLKRDVLLIVRNGRLAATLNTSTGGGYTYVSQGYTSVATTPVGVFHILRQINGMDVAPLGQLWRPKFFYSGFAIHGSPYVPAEPASHGCVRLSFEAMNWVWASNQMPIGMKVWIYN